MRRLLLTTLALAMSFNVSANEYERHHVGCEIFGTIESVSNEKVNLPNTIKIEANIVSIVDSNEIVKISDIRSSEFQRSINGRINADIENPIIKKSLLEDISFEKFGSLGQFIVKLGTVKKKDVPAFLEELGAKNLPSFSKSNLMGPLNLSILSNGGTKKIQIHFPIGDEFDGLSYHIMMFCYTQN